MTSEEIPERFLIAYKKLINATLDGTLTKGDCESCAIGTICNGWVDWSDIFCGGAYTLGYENYLNKKPQHRIYKENIKLAEKRLVKDTGYSIEQCQKIEEAFETAYYSKSERLKSVIELMMKYDGITDPQYLEKIDKLYKICEENGRRK